MELEAETKNLSLPAVGDSVRVATLGRYELIQKLGHGGMATVFLARARGLGGFEKLVAVKVIHSHLAEEPEFVEMFLNEARVAARLHSPHIGEVLDVGRDEGRYFMVMEYIEGETLSSLLSALRTTGERLPMDVALQIVTDACAGLSAVHELRDESGNSYGLVHRDVSPQNLLITMDAWVKLVDFGIVKATGVGRSGLTKSLRGKVSYMAPEQAKGRALSPASDVFALGIVLWELCAGRRLFDGVNEAETLRLVMRCEVPRLRDVIAAEVEVPASLQALLDRALASSPEQRFASATEMLSALRRLSLGVTPASREALSMLMDASFGAQMTYRRTIARRGSLPRVGSPISIVKTAAEREFAGVVAAGDRFSSSGRALSVVRAQEGREVLERGASERSSGRLDLRSFSETAETTRSSTLNSARASVWSLWLLLPLLGAGIAVMVINFNSGTTRDTVEPRPSAVAARAEREAPAPAPSPVVSESTHVTWFITTEPAGARILALDGLSADGAAAVREQIADAVTPVKIELLFQREPVTVTIVKDGYRQRRVVKMPVADENIEIRLAHKHEAAGARQHAQVTTLKSRGAMKSRRKQAKKKVEPAFPSEPSFVPLQPRKPEVNAP
jgi:serine/threonine-protein kinase